MGWLAYRYYCYNYRDVLVDFDEAGSIFPGPNPQYVTGDNMVPMFPACTKDQVFTPRKGEFVFNIQQSQRISHQCSIVLYCYDNYQFRSWNVYVPNHHRTTGEPVAPKESTEELAQQIVRRYGSEYLMRNPDPDCDPTIRKPVLLDRPEKLAIEAAQAQNRPWDVLPVLAPTIFHVFGTIGLVTFNANSDGVASISTKDNIMLFQACSKAYQCSKSAAFSVDLTSGKAAGAVNDGTHIYTYTGDYQSQADLPDSLKNWINPSLVATSTSAVPAEKSPSPICPAGQPPMSADEGAASPSASSDANHEGSEKMAILGFRPGESADDTASHAVALGFSRVGDCKYRQFPGQAPITDYTDCTFAGNSGESMEVSFHCGRLQRIDYKFKVTRYGELLKTMTNAYGKPRSMDIDGTNPSLVGWGLPDEGFSIELGKTDDGASGFLAWVDQSELVKLGRRYKQE